MLIKKSVLLVIAVLTNSAFAVSSASITLNLLPANDLDLNQIVCQNNQCNWSNSASSNIKSGESDNDFCRGNNQKVGGNSIRLGNNAYGMSLPSGIAVSEANLKNRDAILQLFNTPYNKITPQMLREYVKLGYSAIWISPPQKNAYVPYWKKNIPAWYGAYQPVDFGQIGDEHNIMSFGSAWELANLVNEAHKAGLQVIVDLAIHQFAQPGVNNTPYYTEYPEQKYNFESGNMAAIQTFWWPQTRVKNYLPLPTLKCSDSNNYDTPASIALVGNNPNGKAFANKVVESTPWQNDFSGLNGWFDGVLPAGSNSSVGVKQISCRTEAVFAGFSAWLLGADYAHGNIKTTADPLRGFNVDGFRIDDISGQSVEFYNRLFKDVAKYNKSGNLFFGEYPTESATDYYQYMAINTGAGNQNAMHTMKMLNFPLLIALKQAFSGNQFQQTLQASFNSQYAYQGIGKIRASNAINLVIDQDTAPDSISSRAMCPWDGKAQFPDYVMNYYSAPLAYGIILAMEAGTPYIFADIQAQNQLGLTESGLWSSDVANGSVSYWNENEVIAGVYFHNHTLGKTMQWGEANHGNNDVAVFTRGDDYLFIVNKSANSYQANNSLAQLKDGSYIDLMSHQVIRVKNHTLEQVYIPKQAVMYFVPFHGRV